MATPYGVANGIDDALEKGSLWLAPHNAGTMTEDARRHLPKG